MSITMNQAIKTINSNKFTVFMILSFAIFISLYFPTVSSATVVTGFDAGRIIDDAVMTNSNSMNISQIQAFLNSKVPVCDTNGTQTSEFGGGTRAQWAAARGYYPPFTCLKDYTEGGLTSAQIIYNASQQYQVNPQVLIVLLQKEQGLVTDTWPTSNQYRSATGYGCPDSTPGVCDSSYYGFTNQINNASKLFHSVITSSPTWYSPYVLGNNNILWSPNSSCGTSTVNIQNLATVSLYDYTPYRPNQASLNAGYGTGDSCSSYGNRNFYSYFTDWFGSTSSTILIQSPSSPAVFLHSESTRYGIPSYDVIKAYGLTGIKVTPVSDVYMNSIADGGTLGTIFTKDGEGAVYLADNGYRFGFTNQSQCIEWGYPTCLSSNTKSLSPSIFNIIANGGDLKSLMLNGNSVSVMVNGQKWPFMTYKALKDKGYTSSDITPITNLLNSSQPIGYSIPENNSFVKFGNNPVIYIYNNGIFYAIESYDIFRSILPVNYPVYHDIGSLYTNNPPTSSKVVPNFITINNGQKTYMFGGGGKFDITAVANDWPNPLSFDEISNIVEAKKTDAGIGPDSTFQLPSGMLFQVKNQTIQQFYSVYDFFASSYIKLPTVISNELIQGLDNGPIIIAPGSGSLFKINDPTKYEMIFTLNSDSSICSLSSLDQLGSFKLQASNVQRIDTTQQYKEVLSSLIVSSDGNYYIINNGSKILLSIPAMTNWGIKNVNPCSFTTNFLTRFKTQIKSALFARLPNGSIFYAKDGAGHQVLTYNTFLELGGNTQNTIDVPYDFLTYIANSSSPIQ